MNQHGKPYKKFSYLMMALLSALLMSACQKSAEEHASEPQATETADATTTTEPVDNPADKMPRYNPEVIKFTGFGPAAFGSNEEAVRQAWGYPLLASTPSVGATCYYLYKEALPQLSNTHQRGIAFMFEDGQFVRYDVDDSSLVAPGNIVVGDSLDKILSVHTQFTQVQPHKYIEGAKTVIVSEEALTEASQTAKLIFELDAQNKVIMWRIGVAPQVYYVEGCN